MRYSLFDVSGEQKFYNENNATLKRLYLKPFNSKCLTATDYTYLTGLAICLFVIICYFYIFVCEAVCKDGKHSILFCDPKVEPNQTKIWEALSLQALSIRVRNQAG